MVTIYPVLQVPTGQIQPVKMHIVEFKRHCATLVMSLLCCDPVLTDLRCLWTNSFGLRSAAAKS